MTEMPDVVGFELEAGLAELEKNDLTYRLVENSWRDQPGKDALLKRIVRQRWLDSGEVEITYSVDTYQLGNAFFK